VDAIEHLFETVSFLLEVVESGFRQTIDAGGTRLADAPGSDSSQPTFRMRCRTGESEPSSIGREIAGEFLDVLDQSITVHRH
jgi:hypothetical protein